MEERITFPQVAKKLKVTYTTVSNWAKDGLRFEVEKRIGHKPRKVTTMKNVYEYLEAR